MDREELLKPINKRRKSKYIFEILLGLFIIVILSITFMAGYIVRGGAPVISSGDYLGEEVYEILEQNWYHGNEDFPLETKSVKGLIKGLEDPYTSFFSAKEASEFNQSVNGNYEGIGVGFNMVDLGAIIVRVYENTPSSDAKLMVGDIITAVDGTSLQNKTSDDVVNLVKGVAGSVTTLTIQRGIEIFDVEVERRAVDISIFGEIITIDDLSYGYVELTTFGSDSGAQLQVALEEFEAAGITNLVLDFRGNGGGYLSAASDILNLFVEEGQPIYQMQYNKGAPDITSAKGGKKFNFNQNYVLVNGQSASASELVAGTLREMADFTLVGTQTFGKGTAQTQVELSDGSTMKYTYASWLSAKGKSIHEVGLEPDVIIENTITDYYVPEIKTPIAVDQVSQNILSMQSMLKVLGYEIDREDGYFSIKSQEALKTFEKNQGLQVNGIYENTDQQYLVSQIQIHSNDETHDQQIKAVEEEIKKSN